MIVKFKMVIYKYCMFKIRNLLILIEYNLLNILIILFLELNFYWKV